ncbi:hypothetical protein PV10_04030 [Exophiala mesophila]|uniref:Uncharacterized protein n=1 Tax=Exophiala mesophila TaxID=212818 RepID=A0A0D1ZDH5_EXOME|nr:uncharacterized protein PV10_04030 [Exophiala mesophila]KIV92762.1 hypothetical protein PV10_04030 [Exophiala mesophila]
MLSANSDINNSRPDRRFRYAAGDFGFEILRSRTRANSFLQKNIDLFLDKHQHRLQNTLSQNSLQSHGISTASNSHSPAIPDQAFETKRHSISSSNMRGRGAAVNSQQATPQSQGDLAGNGPARGPDSNARSSTSRRSLRQLDHQNFQPESSKQLVIDLKNIRKKLNFKTNWLQDDERSAKRRKRDQIRCKCHLTVWDNRDGASESPLRALTKDCWVTPLETAADGFFVDIELSSPFILTPQDLMVTRQTKHGLITSIIDKYFMEIKLLPCRPGGVWPPIPTLGKSDGDQYAPHVKADSGELQGALSARYMRLPLPPERDVALSVYFLFGGITYRTKYGLQVFSEWQPAKFPQAPNGIDLAYFKPEAPPSPPTVGRRSKTRTKSNGPVVLPDQQNNHGSGANKRKAGPDTTTRNSSNSYGTSITPEVSYTFAPACSTDFNQTRPRATVEGYRCVTCSRWKADRLEKLLFHLSTCHPKYIFEVQEARERQSQTKTSRVEIKVDLATPPAVKRDHSSKKLGLSKRIALRYNQAALQRFNAAQRSGSASVTQAAEERPFEDPRDIPPYDHDRLDEKEFSWSAPRQAFDLPAYTNGDRNWVGGKPTRPLTVKANVPGPKNGGKPLRPSEVPDFRKPNYKRHAPVSLSSTGIGQQPSYTSISHRPLSPSEEPLSETDDEIDNEWQIQQHLEDLDHFAAKAKWSDQERDFRKRWDRHRMEERYEHASFISNSLVRFVRKNQQWLAKADHKLLSVFFDFLDRLKSQRRITDDFVVDLSEMIYLTPAKEPAGNSVVGNGIWSNGARPFSLNNNGGRATSQLSEDDDIALQLSLQPNRLLDPSKKNATSEASRSKSNRPQLGFCGLCFKQIDVPAINGTFCTNESCSSPGTMYHAKCVETSCGGEKAKNKAADLDQWKCKWCASESSTANEVSNPTHQEPPVRFSREGRSPLRSNGIQGLPPESALLQHHDRQYLYALRLDGQHDQTRYQMEPISPNRSLLGNGSIFGRPQDEVFDVRRQMDKLKNLTQPKSLLSRVDIVECGSSVEDEDRMF